MRANVCKHELPSLENVGNINRNMSCVKCLVVVSAWLSKPTNAIGHGLDSTNNNKNIQKYRLYIYIYIQYTYLHMHRLCKTYGSICINTSISTLISKYIILNVHTDIDQYIYIYKNYIPTVNQTSCWSILPVNIAKRSHRHHGWSSYLEPVKR